MQILETRSNQTEIQFDNGYRVLFSYSTPVIAHRNGERPLVVNRKYSVTTSRHVNDWLRRNGFTSTVTTTPEVLASIETAE